MGKLVVLIVSVDIILLFLIGSYYNHQSSVVSVEREKFSDLRNAHPSGQVYKPGPEKPATHTNDVKPQQGMDKNEVFATVPTNVSEKNNKFGLHGNQYPTDSYPKDTLTASELLLNDPNSKWRERSY